MSTAKSGDTVKVHYRGTLDDGTEFDSSRGGEPLVFTLGSGNIIPGFEQAVLNMSSGQSKKFTLPSDQAYGPRHDHLVQEVPRSVIPDNIKLQAGITLRGQAAEGQTLNFTVVEFDDSSVKLDGNHPLAGRDLTFELELVEIV